MEIKVRRLLKDLANPDDDLRALATMTLLKIDYPEKETRSKVLSALIGTTKDKNVAVRFFARKAIDKIKRINNRTINQSAENASENLPIEERIYSDDYQIRMGAVLQVKEDNIVEMKDKLIEMLGIEEHSFVIAALISSLVHFLDKSEAELLSPFLTDEDNRVRSNTIEAMEFLKAEESIPALFTALSDRDNRIRAVAAKALQSFGEEKVFTELKKMLDSDEEWMKGSAIYALSHIQASQAITMLIEVARVSKTPETRLKAIIALANYDDSTSFGFLKHVAIAGDDPFKEAAVRALKLVSEKFGEEPPKTTLIDIVEEKTAEEETDDNKKEAGKPADLASTVSRFFRKGRDEAVGLSKRSVINFAVTDLEKEVVELQKEVGKIVFVMYQTGSLNFPDLLTIGHEILRMNFFIKKYSADKAKEEKDQKSSFLGQLKSLFSKVDAPVKMDSKATKFLKKKEELLRQMGRLAFEKCEQEELQHKAIDGFFLSYQNLTRKLNNEKKKLEVCRKGASYEPK